MSCKSLFKAAIWSGAHAGKIELFSVIAAATLVRNSSGSNLAGNR
jgi:hypothetical protein